MDVIVETNDKWQSFDFNERLIYRFLYFETTKRECYELYAKATINIFLKAKREAPSRPHKGYNLANAINLHVNITAKKFDLMSKLDKL